METINKRVIFGFLPVMLFVFTVITVGQVAYNGNELNIGPAVAFATGDGGGDGGGTGDGGGDGGGGWTPTYSCTNGATNYPYCNNNVCTNGATNYPHCNNNVCTNGATNYPSCNVCPSGKVYQNGQCITPTPVCTNGATNYPYCNACPAGQYYVNGVCTTTVPTCTNGATNYPACNICPANYVYQNGTCVYHNPTCINGATNYPYCNVCPAGQYYVNGTCTYTQPTCTNGATNYPSCNVCPTNYIFQNGTCVYHNPTCSNGATNYPYCNVCPAGQYYVNGTCTYTQPTCTNGATNYPSCNVCPTNYIYQNGTCVYHNPTCTNGATNYPYCNNNTCTNGATNYPSCNVCPSGYTYINGACTYQVQYCSNGATNYPSCNVCPSGQYYVNGTCTYTQPTCSNNATNYPYCNVCPTNYTYVNGSCVYQVTTCSNGATNYPYCNNNTCTNGATNFPYCNNNTCSNGATNYPSCNNNVVWCNGVQYYAGYVCPTFDLSVSTTGSTPQTTTATLYGYVNPYSTNASIWFEYGTSASNLGWQTTRQSTQYSGQFTGNLSGLTCGTRYYYRAVAQNSVSTKYGTTLSFVTPNCYTNYSNDSVITRLATSVGSKSAQLNGAFINGGNNSSCVSFFNYGTNYNLVKRTAGQTLYTNYTTNYFSQAVYGLAPNTTYYYKAGVTCADGTKYGNIYSFKTGSTYVYVNKKKVVNYVPAPKTVVTDTEKCNCEIPEYMNISVEALESEAAIGKTANYRVFFKNVSEKTLTNVAVRVVLPEELTINSSERGQYTKGGRTVTYTIPMLRELEEGSFVVTADVLNNLQVGRQIVVNGYSDYTVSGVLTKGNITKGEVTAYTISVAGNGTSLNPANNGNVVTGTTNSWMPQNALEWIIFALVFVIFLSALRYLFTAFSK